MKRIFLSILFLVLVSSGIALAERPIVIVDQKVPNIWSVSFFYDHRWVDANVPYFNKASGDYFLLSANIKTGEALEDYDKIHGVKATHSPTGYEYDLRRQQNCVFFPGLGDIRSYNELIRPEDWMYEGIWTIELKYVGVDGYKHVQEREISMVKPYALTTLQQPRVEKTSDGQFRVSWLAQGAPPEGPPPSPAPGLMVFNYRVFIYDMTTDNMDCPKYQINLPSTGFDSGTWRVNFLIPAYIAGKPIAGKPIRMETRALVGALQSDEQCIWIAHRAAYMTVLP